MGRGIDYKDVLRVIKVAHYDVLVWKTDILSMKNIPFNPLMGTE